MTGALATAKILTKVLQECFLSCFLLIGVYPKKYFFEQKGEFLFIFHLKIILLQPLKSLNLSLGPGWKLFKGFFF